MDAKTISVEFPSDILLALNESEVDFKNRIKLSLAMRLYKNQKLTIGKSAELAGMSRHDFENVLADHEIPISLLSFDDVLKDVMKLNQ